MIIGITVIEFRFFNLKEKKKKYEELQYCISANISHCIQWIFIFFLIRGSFWPIHYQNVLRCRMKCIVKVKIEIFKCTGLMPSDLANPYIQVLAYL